MQQPGETVEVNSTAASLQPEKKALHFVQLDTLRFLAAFMIVFSHAFAGWAGEYKVPHLLQGTDGNWSAFGKHVDLFTRNLNLGVDVFFLISGFLITYLLLREKSERGKINIPGFFLRRILRIWPLYFFVIAVSPFLVNWLGYVQPDYKSSIFFYNNFHTIRTQSWDFPFAHFWSICIEEHFYLVWPFLVALVPVKRLPVFLLLIIAISIGFRAYVYNSLDKPWFDIYMNTLSRIDVLAVGGLAAWLHFHHPYKLRIPLVVRLLLFGTLLVFLFFDDVNDWSNTFQVCMKKYLYIGLCGILMMHYVFSPTGFFKWGPKHIFNYLGRCSYGIYLWGNILLPVIMRKVIMPIYGNNGRAIVYWPYVIIISLLVPVISYELIERPFLKLKSRFSIIKTRI